MLSCSTSEGIRCSIITLLDDFLLKYESEYYYLFSLVYNAANSKDSNLKQYYSMPNIARKLLETFLSFHWPAESGRIAEQLEHIKCDDSIKIKIKRFLDANSHAGHIAELEHDPSILHETKSTLRDLLGLIENDDKQHFDEMKKMCRNHN